jgi:nitrate/nitrite transport system ATP-binding protein
VKLPRPRERLQLANDPTYIRLRKAVLEFLYQKQLKAAA